MTGTFILSLDTEIAWGTYDNLQARATAFERYPELIRRLIRQLNIYEIPATWALVGSLLLNEGEKAGAFPPQYSFATQPDTERVYNSGYPQKWFYWRGIVDLIQSMRVEQEIASHTMTHLLIGDANVSRDMFAAQLNEVVLLHQKHSLPAPYSLVYPRNLIDYTDILLEHGFRAYRGVEKQWYATLPTLLRRGTHLLHMARAGTPPTYAPLNCLEASGLVNLPASQFLLSYDSIRAKIPTSVRVAQAQKGIQQAIKQDEIYHLWFHPFNLGSDDEMFDALAQIFSFVWEERERGNLQTLTMQAAARVISPD